MNTEEILLNVPDDLKEYLDVPQSTDLFYHERVPVTNAMDSDVLDQKHKRVWYRRYYLANTKSTKEEAQEAVFGYIKKLKDHGVKVVAYFSMPSVMKVKTSPESTEDWFVAFFIPYLNLVPDFSDNYEESLKKLQFILDSATEEGNIAGQ